MRYFGKNLELNSVEKAYSILKDKMEHSDVENSFDNLMSERKYFEAASIVKEFSNIPEHKKVNLINGLLDKYVNYPDFTKAPDLQKLNETLGYIPRKIEIASFLVELNIDIKYMTKYKDYNKNTNFDSKVLDFLKQPNMIDSFKREMKDCFDKFNEDCKNSGLNRDYRDVESDNVYNEIYWSKNTRNRMADKFMQLSILIDENQLSNTSMKSECVSLLKNHMKIINNEIKNQSDFVKNKFSTALGYEGFENIYNFGTEYQFENRVTKTNMLSAIKNMKNDFLNIGSDNKNSAKITQ